MKRSNLSMVLQIGGSFVSKARLCETSLTLGWGSVTLGMEIVSKSAWLGKGPDARALLEKGKEVARVVTKREDVTRVDIRVRIERRVRDGRRFCAGDRPGDHVE